MGKKQKKSFYLQSAHFYGKNRDKTYCLQAINLVTKLGLSTAEKEALVAQYLK